MLKSNFPVNNLGLVSSYLGIRIIRDGSYFLLDQENYIRTVIKEFGLSEAKVFDTPMDIGYQKEDQDELLPSNEKYRKAIGSLLYVSINTRPDIAASVTILAQKVAQPSKRDWNAVKRLMRYLKGTFSTKLKLGFESNETKLVGYADAHWAEERQTRRSNSGYVFLLGGPISWSCRKQTCVALSSTESEFIALSEAAREAVWIRRLLKSFGINMVEPTIVFEDNQSCLKIIREEKFSCRTKHIDVRAHYVKDHVDKMYIKCIYCESKKNIADLLTKPLARTNFNHLKSKFNLI